jgi:putative endonuclease
MMMSDRKMRLGSWGESLAVEYLSAHGVSILARNARTKYGELDIVGCLEGMTVIFEVKTRRTDTYGFPEEAISRIKRQHLIESSEAFLQDHPELPGEWRIDVIAIRLKPGVQPEIEWFTNAVS